MVPRSIARPNQHDPVHACDRITHDRINSFHRANASADTQICKRPSRGHSVKSIRVLFLGGSLAA